MEYLFDSFYTTKERGKGTGLGLAIARDIVEAYRGELTFDRAPTGGLVVSIRLPVAT